MISMQFKTWLRLHEDKNMSSLPEELKPEEIAKQHFKAVVPSMVINKTKSNDPKPDGFIRGKGKHKPIAIEIKQNSRGEKRIDSTRMNHRQTDKIIGGGAIDSTGKKLPFTTEDLAKMLKIKEKITEKGTRYTGRLSYPSFKVFKHIMSTGLKNEQLKKPFKDETQFDKHYSTRQGEYDELIKHWWETGNDGKPLSIEPHSHLIMIHPTGQIIRTEKQHNNSDKFNEILSSHRLGKISELQTQHGYGGFTAQFHNIEGSSIKNISSRWSLKKSKHLDNSEDPKERIKKGRNNKKIVRQTRSENIKIQNEMKQKRAIAELIKAAEPAAVQQLNTQLNLSKK